jgi:hypothetical protein
MPDQERIWRVERAIRFTRNGQLEDRGIVETITPSEIINGNPRYERPDGSGTYRLEPYTLRLRYSDGYERTLPIVVEPAEIDRQALGRISVNTLLFGEALGCPEIFRHRRCNQQPSI